MPRFLMPLIALLAALPVFAQAQEPVPRIELRAHCLDRLPCVFDGHHLEIELEVLNAGQAVVQLPAEHYRRQGPIARLVDNRTGARRVLGRSTPTTRWERQLETLAPGRPFRLRWWVMSNQILDFASHPVDVTAESAYPLQPELGARTEFIRASVPIVGK